MSDFRIQIRERHRDAGPLGILVWWQWRVLAPDGRIAAEGAGTEFESREVIEAQARKAAAVAASQGDWIDIETEPTSMLHNDHYGGKTDKEADE